ncbi:MAG TPA: DUF1292 domain-containing protein [Firmicutes bacterium]|jgi:uncharacterized protein YrzB (UPF0473 family)|nr:DUF1292 domain-containing protein [Bacillota bacterium]
MTEHEHAEEFVILTDEDGNEYEFEVVDVIEVDGNSYAILYPVDEESEDEGYVIMRFALDEEDEEILVDIEDDEEWEKVVSVWEELIEEEGFEDDEDDVQ